MFFIRAFNAPETQQAAAVRFERVLAVTAYFLAESIEFNRDRSRNGMIDGSYLMRLANRLRRAPSKRDGRTEADRLLTRRICRMVDPELERAGVGGLQFYVRDGSVTVFGPVADESRSELVLSLLQRVPGIHRVVSQLQVIDPEVLQPLNQRRRLSPHA